ncbi:hypothetical protein L2E82_13211 [Cichorium intybus]|uniref:Uncharacterized protein n=1 Tax=Cichorium intybus TaxID=13427 RepID=A0ACB9GK78_CICIN|nr:hypothetical protein L2E82_13211 [Cichorium intybus]
MISVGSRDGRKGLSLRYGVEGGDMDLETELEEGEACFQNDNDDDSTIDPDVALSYLDEKLQDVLGHFQKDFEGGVSAENLGAKFGGYGSFLPTYQRSPACPHPKTPPKIPTTNPSISPNHLHIEGGLQSSVSTSNASQLTKLGPPLTSGPPPKGPLMNGKVKQEMHTLSNKAGDKFSSSGQPVNNNTCDQKSLKVRIKVGSDNLSTRKNAEIYSGLGLDVSPSSSLEASPVDSDDFCHVPNESPHEESPTSILEMMTSFPVLGGLLLSPLPYELLYLTEKEKQEDSSCGSVHKKSQESTLTVNRPDTKVDLNEKKPKNEGNLVQPEPINGNSVRNGIGGVTKKEADMDNLSCEEPVSNAMRLDFRKGAAFKGGSSGIMPKEESLDPVLTQDDIQVEKPYKKDAVSDEKYSTFPTKSDSDVSKNGKIQPPKQKAAHKATSREKDSTKLSTPSSAGKKKSKGNLENGFESVEVSKVSLKNDPSSKSKNNTHGSKMDDPRGNNVKVRATYKDFFGELDPELEEGDDMALEEKPFGDRQKDNRVTEKGSLESNVLSKDRLNGKKDPKPSSVVYPGAGPHVAPITGPAPVSDAASATVAAVVNEDWVCCDKCEKWRLLPPGVNPGSLPEKWLCSMLDWLPGMNRCSISQEETTKAIMAHFPGPTPTVQGFQPVHPGGPATFDPPHADQRHQPFGPQIGVKKKHGAKDVANEPKQERPSLSSNSAKKNLHTSNKTRSLNGANQSPSHLEFQDSGQSSSLIADKHKLKHKEKKKLCENSLDEGNNNNPLQLKIRNKRETSQDYSRDSKKVKTDDNHGTDKDWGSDHRKNDDRPKDSKSASKVLGVHPKIPNGTPHVVNKRKANELEDAQIEETSENGHRKGKKVKVPEPQEEEIFASKGSGGGEGRVRLIDSSRRDVPVPLHAPLAATSSSSKVSGSHKTKTNNQETKGSPVESVSSSPLRILNPDKLISSRRNIEGVENCQDVASPKKDWEDDRGSYRSNTFKKELDVMESLDKGVGPLTSSNNLKAEIAPSLEFETFRVGSGGVDTSGAKPSTQGHNDDRSHSNGSRSRKNGKGSSSRSKDKNRSSKSDIDKINLKISDVPIYEEKSKGGRHKSQEKPSVYPDKLEKGSASKKDSSKPSSENTKRDAQSKHGHNDDSVPAPVHDVKQNVSMEREGERLSKRDVSGRGKSHSLPPTGKSQNDASRPPQPFVGSQKENVSVEGSDASKATKQKKKAENQSTSARHPTPNRHKGRDHDAPSPLRRESSSQAASSVKEAKALKHMADRLKNSGSNHESNSLYFQAALKFLYGSSLLESSYTENGKHGDMIQSTAMYSSTAKLCEYVAHEYEKVKEMAAAALAYKLAEVAYLKVVYSSHSSACKDRQELQTSLQIGPTGESPSSSASDIDNLNNPAAIDKAALPKGANDPQIAGNHVIAARNKPNFLRILNFAQDVNFAMEASRRSQIAYAACGSQPEHAHHKEVIKPALDFNFQDVEGLLQLVRVAMEVISSR